MNKFENWEAHYEEARIADIEEKYFPFSRLENCLEQLPYEKTLIGRSFLGEPIYKLSIGNAKRKILIWSQMHGNESTGTRAMLDLLNYFHLFHGEVAPILSEIQFDFIPMLNPDGANVYSRRNAMGIDMNRDFIQKASPEIKILVDQVHSGNYEVLFNLHDQRTIFSVGQSTLPATLSFLAPSGDWAQTITSTRIKTMAIIQFINESLQKYIPGQVGRYSAEFYPNATGDNFTKMNLPTVLFEAGHFPGDYQRNQTRKYNFFALLKGIEAVANKTFEVYTSYDAIPENGKRFTDIIARNVTIKSDNIEGLVDLSIYFEDRYDEEKKTLIQKAVINEIGDLGQLIGHEEWDFKGEIFKGMAKNYPILNQEADFFIGNCQIINGKKLN